MKKNNMSILVKENKQIEMYSSAFTLSDMEIFVFPELLYALVIANIMSPVIWEWRDDHWFKNIEKKSYIQRINRVKQYIMNNFVFNLDLETWGLTTEQRELERFSDFLDKEIIQKSNALFGYEGDKYYFDIDIRKHFGLDKYTTNVIPYWKTETVEAMQSFQYKPNFTTGAGECVSLSALYAAALFVVARVPLERIFIIATPLHSQNFIDIKEGILTNNRRIVTKNMWFNGTSISTKARRALEKEQVTIVSHITGYIHTVYKEATIDPREYSRFKNSLTQFLKADLQPAIISNFLRKEREFQHCFQYCHIISGKKMYIRVESIYQYEHTSSNNFSTDSRNALLREIDCEEFSFSPIQNRILINDFEAYIKEHAQLTIDEFIKKAREELSIKECPRTEALFDNLKDFLLVQPSIPENEKIFTNSGHLEIPLNYSRDNIIEYIHRKAKKNRVAELALYAYRDMDLIDWQPFIKASIERNPVSIEALKDKCIDEIVGILQLMNNRSIYNNNRLALPDEVWNFQTGDGIEKAILLLNILKDRFPEKHLEIIIDYPKVFLKSCSFTYEFSTEKYITKKIETP